MLKSALVVALCALPLSAKAMPLACTFISECLDTEGCQSTSYEVTFGPVNDRFLMSGIAGARAFDLLSQEDGHRAYVSDAQNRAVGLMTLLADGAATYTEVGLFEGAYAVRYHGECGE